MVLYMQHMLLLPAACRIIVAHLATRITLPGKVAASEGDRCGFSLQSYRTAAQIPFPGCLFPSLRFQHLQRVTVSVSVTVIEKKAGVYISHAAPVGPRGERVDLGGAERDSQGRRLTPT